MKIGIIIHSQTGNTLSVAERLQEKLLAGGHAADIIRLVPDDEKQRDPGRIKLQDISDPGAYDVLVLGAPVQGASASPAFKAFAGQAASFQGKKIFCFVTEFFPFSWMGGSSAIGQMKKLCETKGGTVAETGVVNWKSGKKERQIADIVDRFSRAI